MKLLICNLIFLLMLGCSVEHEVVEPKKPSQVPESALWVGGMDGGVFIKVKEKSNKYIGEVYYISGDIAYKGELEIHPKGSTPPNLEAKESFTGWDGDIIYLSNDSYLKINE